MASGRVPKTTQTLRVMVRYNLVGRFERAHRLTPSTLDWVCADAQTSPSSWTSPVMSSASLNAGSVSNRVKKIDGPRSAILVDCQHRCAASLIIAFSSMAPLSCGAGILTL